MLDGTSEGLLDKQAFGVRQVRATLEFALSRRVAHKRFEVRKISLCKRHG